ncbi:(1-_4)-alpha-D-glucan 1-alpha-D-glucosylmutase [Arcanobacterium wilhelmae]|uniref:(1->4)-alpha-D-glucan 1-alpha-D-glucosylmutase n=1 Tax=Arcanobacterium wilhelmae TaxID=1803177 RepID=A0ABT9N8X1_9ACTO|nr:malto-oligosyltrehalose synthase [Arcanobacterium wilhelmae]MDP9800143.1 (1->4)-alpha-D-glucan 1-alpha-D-glucosylmutase [Arcanobacterium wilhelmae]WFN89583.1 malto-oligosyltrehalose synthase [Arcanobacterium wilhelmae]
MSENTRHHTHVPATGRRTPVTSYRLQLNADFTFADAESIIPYLSSLGVTDVFFSPILQAAPGSTHGYDVVDHSRISEDLGGRAAFEHAARAFHEAGMGVIVDVVPNHMAVPTPLYKNPALWSMLRDGHDSPYDTWFDFEPSEAGDGLLLAVLGDRIGNVLTSGEITVENMVVPGFEADGEVPVLRYYDHVFPVRAGTESLPLAELINRQYYRLAYWRVANDELNYRRFFDVDTLVAVRVEDDAVFRASHALLLELFDTGLIDAFRIDHVDGLADPRGYLRRLNEATSGAWIVAEKILEGAEQLPSDWPIAGTTGYDTLRHVGGVLTEPAGIAHLIQIYTEESGRPQSLATIEHDAKRQIIKESLFSEVDRLSTLIWEIFHADVRLRDHTFRSIYEAIVELVVNMPRYRAYVVPGERPDTIDEELLRSVAQQAVANLDEFRSETLSVVVELLLGYEVGSAGRTHEDKRNEAIVRFQQVAGAVMAKGVEDTTYYRYTPLTSANEVGHGPAHIVASTDAFHAFENHLHEAWPTTMSTLSTHDTKRGEDTRARIAVLSEFATDWGAALTAARTAVAEECPAELDGRFENLMWQTLLGTWVGGEPIETDRLRAYFLKAAREQKSWTTWTAQDEGAEADMLGYLNAILSNDEARTILTDFAAHIAPAARSYLLTSKALQLTGVGVADIYQGEEITQTSLVDPDNRRQVDFPALAATLEALDSDGLPSTPTLDEEKLFLTSRLARLRRERALSDPKWGYLALPVSTGHALAFARTDADGEAQLVTVGTRFAGSLERNGGFAAHTVVLPQGNWHDVLTGRDIAGGVVKLDDLFTDFPVVVLERA